MDKGWILRLSFGLSVFMLAIARVTLAQNSTTSGTEMYQLWRICPETYGFILTTGTGRSHIDCAIRCSQVLDCQSFMYNASSRACRTNSQLAVLKLTNCPSLVLYGEPRQIITIPPPTTTSSTVMTTIMTSPPMASQPPMTTTGLPTTSSPMLELSDLGESCMTFYDCADPLTECLEDTCVCMTGHVYDYSLGQCVYMTNCLAHGVTFQYLPMYTYIGTYNQLITGITIEECLSACIDSMEYICSFVNYYGTQCYLVAVTDMTASERLPQIITSSSSLDSVYQRDCAVPEPRMNMGCNSDLNCWEAESECVLNFCRCKLGFSYDATGHRCVPACYAYSSAVAKFPDYNILTFIADVTLSGVDTSAMCRDMCLSEPTINCVSAVHDAGRLLCLLSASTLEQYSNGDYIDSLGDTVLLRDCAPMASALQEQYCYNSGCAVLNSECREGVCQCRPGYRYSPTKAECISGCANVPGTTFQTLPDLFVLGWENDIIAIAGVDPEDECKAACLNHPQLLCVTAILDRAARMCWVLITNLIDIQQVEWSYDANFVTFTRDCLTE